jgi:hypothetical protein
VLGSIARARGDLEGAADLFTGVVAGVPAGPTMDMWERLLVETVVVLTELGRPDDARPVVERLRRMGDVRVQLEPYARWAEGLVTAGPAEAVTALREAVAGFEAREQPIDAGRCLIALAGVEAELGEDPMPTLRRAREILVAVGAGLYVAEADAALAAAG